MKTPITLRSTLSNASWTQRGAAALLLAAALIFALTLILRPNTHAPAATPAVRQAALAARNLNVPISGAGSAYDGGTYSAVQPAAHNSNVSIRGAGSAYDGGTFSAVQPAAHNSNVSIRGTGSTYDGKAYAGALLPVPHAAHRFPIRTAASSAYDGQLYQSAHPVAAPASPALIGIGSAYDGR
jgi:hypothetical protein